MRLANANALKIPFADQSFQCIVTSPPYYGLRDYGTSKWEGGDPNCAHLVRENKNLQSSTLSGGLKTTNHQREGFKDQCRRCGATRIDDQIGIEKTPHEYIAAIVSVMRECWRVLKDDGVLWLNLGDSYNGSGKGKMGRTSKLGRVVENAQAINISPDVDGFKPKDLMMIPARVAIALQADGWYLRSEIIWHKPNPMPESVTDRPTRSHEMIYLLSKSNRYYYDAEAILDPYTEPMNRWGGNKLIANGKSDWDDGVGQSTYRDRDMRPNPNGRNKRTVWTVPTSPYSGAHFATFPSDLIVPCILAGSRKGDRVFDPFVGSGTTIWTAQQLQRIGFGIDLSLKYLNENAMVRAFNRTPSNALDNLPLFAGLEASQ